MKMGGTMPQRSLGQAISEVINTSGGMLFVFLILHLFPVVMMELPFEMARALAAVLLTISLIIAVVLQVMSYFSPN